MADDLSELRAEYMERMGSIIARRDQTLWTIDGAYAAATATGTADVLAFHSGYWRNRAEVVAGYRAEVDNVHRDYGMRAPSGTPPLPDPGPERPPYAAPQPAVLPTPPVPRRRRARLVAAGVIFVAALGVAGSMVNSAIENGRQTERIGKAIALATKHTVLYEVEGTASSVDITIATPSGTSQGANKKVPLASAETGKRGITFTMERGNFVYISAQNQGSAGSVTCRISVDGTVISTNTSSGAYTIASCDGTVR